MIHCPRVVGGVDLVALVATGFLIAVAMADAEVVRMVVAVRRYAVMGIQVQVRTLRWTDAGPGRAGGNRSLGRSVGAVAVGVVAAAAAAAAVANNHQGGYQSEWDRDLVRDSCGLVRDGKQVSSCGCSRQFADCSPEVLGVAPRWALELQNVAWPVCAYGRA